MTDSAERVTRTDALDRYMAKLPFVALEVVPRVAGAIEGDVHEVSISKVRDLATTKLAETGGVFAPAEITRVALAARLTLMEQ